MDICRFLSTFADFKEHLIINSIIHNDITYCFKYNTNLFVYTFVTKNIILYKISLKILINFFSKNSKSNY